jgi:ferritin-like metal-binding protein YciE
MHDLFVHTLQDIYYAEHKILESMPGMIDKASDPDLKTGLRNHEMETRHQVDRLDRVFEMIGMRPKGVDCPAIDGIIKEADEVVGEADNPQVLDAAIVAAAQAIEHYEITRYGTLVAWAKELGLDDCAAILEETLQEEQGADRVLTDVAEMRVNRLAA